MPVSQTQALQQEVNALREQLLDVGDDVTDQASHVLKLRQALAIMFEGLGMAVPDWLQLQDNPRPALQLIRGGGERPGAGTLSKPLAGEWLHVIRGGAR